MTIQEIKKELKLSNKEIARFFNMTYGAFANSSAKQRYEEALCKFYSFLKEGEKKKENEVKELIDFLNEEVSFANYPSELSHTFIDSVRVRLKYIDSASKEIRSVNVGIWIEAQ